MTEGFVVVTEEGKSFFVHSVVPVNTKKKTSRAEYSELFVKFFSRALQNIWRILNTIASILRENLYRYLSLDITTSTKLTVRKTVRILEQIISADKSPYKCLRQIEALVNIHIHINFHIKNYKQFYAAQKTLRKL